MDAVSEFPARVPIVTGQHLGIWIGDHASIAWKETPEADWDVWRPDPPVGTPTYANINHDGALEGGYNVDVEPDVDRDGYGEPSQDQCGTDASTQGACSPQRVPIPAEPVPVDIHTLLRRDVKRAARMLRRAEPSRVLRRRGLGFTVTAAAGGSFEFAATTTRGRKPTLLKGAHVVAGPGSSTLVARLTRTGRRQLRRMRRIHVRLQLSFLDEALVRRAVARATMAGVRTRCPCR